MRGDFRRMAQDVRSSLSRSQSSPGSGPPPGIQPAPPGFDSSSRGTGPYRGGIWAGGVLVIIGLYFLLRNLGLLDWWNWDLFWPLVLIAIGLLIVVRRLRPSV